jgi:IMP dehydrogenase/GMP reductase
MMTKKIGMMIIGMMRRLLMIKKDQKFTFDDILLTPGYAEIDTREGSNATKTKLFNFNLEVPIISSPMDTVTGVKMMKAMHNSGAIGIHHRYCDIEKLYYASSLQIGGIAISPSMNVEDILDIYKYYPNTIFCLDVAHGNTEKNLNFCKDLISNGIVNIISGNLVTPDAVERYLNIGIDHFRVGVGSGSICTTRTVTGFGYPQGSAIHELYQQFLGSIKIIADGGFNTTGDINKAFVLGADYIMSGRLFSGTKECPKASKGGTYRGMASAEALSKRKKNFFAEGESIKVPEHGSVIDVIGQIKNSIKMGCYYGGVAHFSDLRYTQFEFITDSTKVENSVRK